MNDQFLLEGAEISSNTYTCLCCGHSETFESAGAAYHAGWDVAPYFRLAPLCNLCPAAPIVSKGLERARQRHAPAHAQWQREGRPNDFDMDAELALDGIYGTEAETHKTAMDSLRRVIDDSKH